MKGRRFRVDFPPYKDGRPWPEDLSPYFYCFDANQRAETERKLATAAASDRYNPFLPPDFMNPPPQPRRATARRPRDRTKVFTTDSEETSHRRSVAAQNRHKSMISRVSKFFCNFLYATTKVMLKPRARDIVCICRCTLMCTYNVC